MSYLRLRCGKTNVGAGVWLIIFWVFAASAAADAGAEEIWIDTDPAIGAPWREVDDAFALIFAFRSPELKIVGISSSYGNAPLRTTTKIARDLVRRFATRDLSVYPGAQSSAQLGHRTMATDALADALRRYPRLTYIALGPLTNLATFQTLHPELTGRVKRVIFAGGQSSADSLRYGRGDWLNIHDANVTKDPVAAVRVVALPVPILLAPPEVGGRLMMTRDDMRRISGSASGNFLGKRSGVWLWFWSEIVGSKGGPLFDVLPIVAAARPGSVVTNNGFARIEHGQLLFTTERTAGAHGVGICSGFTVEAKHELLRRLAP